MMLMSDSATIEYTDRLVAFVDILGFKNLINAKDVDVIKIIKKLDDNFGEIEEAYGDDFSLLSVRKFSDCMCVSCELSDEGIRQMLVALAFYQALSSMSFSTLGGIFFRGAITIGKHFESSHMIFSKGLVDAYHFEKDRAKYPRILIDDKVDDRIKTVIDPHLRNILCKLVARSPDTVRFLDYLQITIDISLEERENVFRLHKKSILSQIAANDDRKILEKYMWLSDYHNEKLQRSFNILKDQDSKAYENLQKRLLIQKIKDETGCYVVLA